MSAETTPEIRSFFDAATYSYTHVVSDPSTGSAAIIDPVADLDPITGTLSSTSADVVLSYVQRRGLKVLWLLETHVHADHLSAAAYMQSKVGGQTAISREVLGVAELIKASPSLAADSPQNLLCSGKAPGHQFDLLLEDGQQLPLGELSIEVMHTPGHTPACLTYLCSGLCGDKAAFVGDTLFMPDFGTGRTDFPGGCARELYRSIQRLLSLPAQTMFYLCHDYGGENREGFSCIASIAEMREQNVHLQNHPCEESFVAFREGRDKNLSLPALFNWAVPFNLPSS